jgi:hypothetical protein
VRKALNDNPLIAIAVVAVLGLGVALMLMNAMKRPSATSTATTSTTAAVPATGVPATATPATTGVPSTADPSTAAPAGTLATGAPAAAPVGSFEAGPGLPSAVVDAYDSGKVVAIVVLKRNGIDDHAVRQATAPLRSNPNVALFTTLASKVARYARVTEGVDLNRVPAIVVLRAKPLTKGSTPQASVAYGFKSLQSATQAVRDATYKGPNNLPSWPR